MIFREDHLRRRGYGKIMPAFSKTKHVTARSSDSDIKSLADYLVTFVKTAGK